MKSKANGSNENATTFNKKDDGYIGVYLRSEIVMMMDGWDWILEGGATVVFDLGPR